MKPWCPVVVLSFAFLSACVGPGCSNTTNESGAGAAAVGGAPPPDAPKTYEEYFKQKEKEKPAKKGSRSAR